MFTEAKNRLLSVFGFDRQVISGKPVETNTEQAQRILADLKAQMKDRGEEMPPKTLEGTKTQEWVLPGTSEGTSVTLKEQSRDGKIDNTVIEIISGGKTSERLIFTDGTVVAMNTHGYPALVTERLPDQITRVYQDIQDQIVLPTAE